MFNAEHNIAFFLEQKKYQFYSVSVVGRSLKLKSIIYMYIITPLSSVMVSTKADGIFVMALKLLL